MKKGQASATASWVAAARSAGSLVPAEMQLARDAHGAELAQGAVGGLTRLCLRLPALGRRLASASAPLSRFLLWMQLRTRALDDILLEFAQKGCVQVVLLGAGYDCRALRFSDALSAVRVFEVDHPATQAQKRAFVQRHAPEAVPERIVFVPWDFESKPLSALPEALRAAGLDPALPTLTVWEGVTMYLTEPAIDASVHAIAAYSAPGSWLAMTYLARSAVQRPRGDAKLTAALVSRVGEPYRFGFEPEALPAWLQAHGFKLRTDDTDQVLATRHLPTRYESWFARGERHIALGERL